MNDWEQAVAEAAEAIERFGDDALEGHARQDRERRRLLTQRVNWLHGVFPHVCVGPKCMVCWWVNDRHERLAYWREEDV